MDYICHDNYFILTGAMGAGKSTVLKELRQLGLVCMDEPARQILAEQRMIAAKGIPEHDPKLFTELLLSRAIYQFNQMAHQQDFVVYDRGIPDNLGYAQFFDLELTPYMNAATQYQYNKQVFFLPPWEKIYKNDVERKMTFAQAKQFGEAIRRLYEDLGYRIIEVPRTAPARRAEFIVQAIMKHSMT